MNNTKQTLNTILTARLSFVEALSKLNKVIDLGVFKDNPMLEAHLFHNTLGTASVLREMWEKLCGEESNEDEEYE